MRRAAEAKRHAAEAKQSTGEAMTTTVNDDEEAAEAAPNAEKAGKTAAIRAA